jgi:hypothetical protein
MLSPNPVMPQTSSRRLSGAGFFRTQTSHQLGREISRASRLLGVDFRSLKEIDGLAQVCSETLEQDPFCSWLSVFCNRRVKALVGAGPPKQQ